MARCLDVRLGASSDRMSEEAARVDTMLGSYRILGELGSGGMGAVYRARHVVLERMVAVKLLRPELTTNRELVRRFVNEAKAASAIRHPGIVDVLDFGHAPDGRAYYVMELLEGESLAHRIATRGRLPERDAARIARAIASALAAAHDRGIVHRDLKPDNVVLVSDPDLGERPKVLDFGIAKLGDLAPNATKYTETGALIGTPLYMAPEQARAASHIDHRADLYSLGCMLYEMLVGEPPFVAIGAGELVALHLFGVPERPSERGVALAAELEHVVMRLLEKEPSERFQTAAQVSDALAAVLGEPAEPAPAALASPAPPIADSRVGTGMVHVAPPARARRWAWLAAALVAVAGTIAFVAMRQPSAPPRSAPPHTAAPVGASPVAPGTRHAPLPQPPAPPPPVPSETPAVEQAAAPAKTEQKPREKARGSAQKSGTAPTKYSKRGSPIEIDLD
jgi:serine/threonine-protein kinase